MGDSSSMVFVVIGVVLAIVVIWAVVTRLRAPKLPPVGESKQPEKLAAKPEKSDKGALTDDTLKKKKADAAPKKADAAKESKDSKAPAAKTADKPADKKDEKKKDEAPAKAADAAPAKVATDKAEPVPAKPEAAPIEAPKVVDKAPSVRPAPDAAPKSTPPVASPEPVAASAGAAPIESKKESVRPPLSAHEEIKDDSVLAKAIATTGLPSTTPDAKSTTAATPAAKAAPAAAAAAPAAKAAEPKVEAKKVEPKVEAKAAPAAAPVAAPAAKAAEPAKKEATPAPAPASAKAAEPVKSEPKPQPKVEAKKAEPEDEAVQPLSFFSVTAQARSQPEGDTDAGEATAVLEENHLFVLAANATGGGKKGTASKVIAAVKGAASTKRGRTSWKRALAEGKKAGAGEEASLVSVFAPGGGPTVEISRIGDGHCYKLRGGTLTRLTADGAAKDMETKKDETADGDLYILCSAELCRTVPDEEIRELLMLDHDPNNGVRDLLAISGDRNPTGDVNVLVVRMDPIEI